MQICLIKNIYDLLRKEKDPEAPGQTKLASSFTPATTHLLEGLKISNFLFFWGNPRPRFLCLQNLASPLFFLFFPWTLSPSLHPAHFLFYLLPTFFCSIAAKYFDLSNSCNYFLTLFPFPFGKNRVFHIQIFCRSRVLSLGLICGLRVWSFWKSPQCFPNFYDICHPHASNSFVAFLLRCFPVLVLRLLMN